MNVREQQEGQGLMIGSLFSGIGGFELAGAWCGHHTIWQSEIDPFCVELLSKHFPDARQLGDITAIDWSTVEQPDIITGGFPCQDISYAGKGAGLAGKRSGLWYEYARAIREMGPRYVIVENVRALFTRGFDAVLGTLADLGYDAEWSMYGAADVGAPHKRQRVWILAYARSLGERQSHHEASTITPRRHAWGDSIRVRDGLGDAEHALGRPHASTGNDRNRNDARGDQASGGPAASGETVVDTASGGRGAGTELAIRRPDGGRAGLVDTLRARGTPGLSGPLDGQEGHASLHHNRGAQLGWHDAVAVRGFDGTVRLVPADVAEKGTQSSLYPVADGVPGRVVRLRGTGNAIVPLCAVPIFARIAQLEAERLIAGAAA